MPRFAWVDLMEYPDALESDGVSFAEAMDVLHVRRRDGSLAVDMAAGVAVVLAYAVAGGMVSGVYTDVFQGTLMVGAAVAVFHYALESGGGLEPIARSLLGEGVKGLILKTSEHLARDRGSAAPARAHFSQVGRQTTSAQAAAVSPAE